MAELQERMGSAEFSEWAAFMNTEPLGEERGDMQAATICSIIANANRDTSKRSEPFQPIDFLPRYWEEREAQQPAMTGEQTLAFMRARMPPMTKEGDLSQPSQSSP